VPISDLLDDPYFLGKGDEIYPSHRADIIELFERKDAGEQIHKFVYEGAIGAGKTYLMSIILWILVYRLITKWPSPQIYLGIDPDSTLCYCCTSRNATLAKKVTFTKILPMFDTPFFREHFPPQCGFKLLDDWMKGGKPYYPSELRFPRGIVIFPGTGSEAATLGYDLLGGLMDEANFLQVTERSTKARGGYYDAAEEIHDSIYDRMISRFQKDGKLPPECLLMMFCSTLYENDFLSRHANDPFTFHRKRTLWEAKPSIHKGRTIWSGKKFKFDVDQLKIVEVPEGYEKYLS